MSYWEAAPDPRLAPFVARVCFSIGEADRDSPPVRVIPDGHLDVLVSVADRGEGEAEVFGAKTRPLFVAHVGKVATFALRLRPGGAAVEVALDAGYFDQPHLVRDFRAFAGAAPSRIFPSRGERARAMLPA